MKMRTEIQKLSTTDIYSLLLFAMYKSTEDPKQSSLSQLAYILDMENMLKLCEFFGGTTLKIPTIRELETLIYSLLLFQEVDIEHSDLESSLENIRQKDVDVDSVIDNYYQMKELLKNYTFNSGRK